MTVLLHCLTPWYVKGTRVGYRCKNVGCLVVFDQLPPIGERGGCTGTPA